MAESFEMVEATVTNDNGEDGVIQIRSSDLKRMQELYGDRLKVKGGAKKAPEPENKKAPVSRNKSRASKE